MVLLSYYNFLEEGRISHFLGSTFRGNSNCVMWRSRVLIGVQETSAALHSGSLALGCGKFWTLVGVDA